MVTRAQRPGVGVGGHISSYASTATLYEVGFNHFFRGKDHPGGGDHIFFQGHASPGNYARAFIEGRLTEADLDGFRQEESRPAGGRGLPSYPHPRRMEDFWEYPTVSMGLGPSEAIYQAWFDKYLQGAGIKDTSQQHTWAFLGDGEMDEPESRGMLQLAANQQLDNLTFVINEHASTASCPSSKPLTVTIGTDGKSSQSCGSTFSTKGVSLSYGSAAKNSTFACESADSGMQCWSQVTGQGFILSRESVTPTTHRSN